MTEVLQLTDLFETAQRTHPDVEPAIAVIAEADPILLEDSVARVIEQDRTLGLQERAANRAHKIEAARSSRIRISPNLCEAAQAAIAAESNRATHQEETQFAQEVRASKYRLSSPMRVTATVLCALAFAGGGEVKLYEQNRNDQTAPDGVILHGAELEIESGIISFIGGAMGAVLGVLGGVKFSDVEARRRARRIVSKQASSTSRVASI